MIERSVIRLCKDLGCCDACCVRYLGLKNPSSYENVHQFVQKYLNEDANSQSQTLGNERHADLNLLKENSVNADSSPVDVDDAQPNNGLAQSKTIDVETDLDGETAGIPPAKRIKLDDVCVACLGILQEETWPEAFTMVQELLEKKRYECETIAFALSSPIAAILRERAISLHLEQASSDYELKAPMPLKEAWKWSFGRKLAEIVGKRLDSGAVAPLLVTLNVEYPDDAQVGAGDGARAGAGAVRGARQAAAALRGGVHAALRGAGAGERGRERGRPGGGGLALPAAPRRPRARRQRRGRARAAVPGRPLRQAVARPAADAVAGGGAPHDALVSAGDHLRTRRGRLRAGAGGDRAEAQIDGGGPRGRRRALPRHRPPFRARDSGPAPRARRRGAAARLRAHLRRTQSRRPRARARREGGLDAAEAGRADEVQDVRGAVREAGRGRRGGARDGARAGRRERVPQHGARRPRARAPGAAHAAARAAPAPAAGAAARAAGAGGARGGGCGGRGGRGAVRGARARGGGHVREGVGARRAAAHAAGAGRGAERARRPAGAGRARRGAGVAAAHCPHCPHSPPGARAAALVNKTDFTFSLTKYTTF